MAIFFALAGTWTFCRTCRSDRYLEQNAVVSGQATFAPTSFRENARDYAYEERGTLHGEFHQGRCSRQYAYILDEQRDEIQVHFRRNDCLTGLFHVFRPTSKPSGSTGGGCRHLWTGTGAHLCGTDHYYATHRFEYFGAHLVSFSVVYRVEGPAKNYESSTRFFRANFSSDEVPDPVAPD